MKWMELPGPSGFIEQVHQSIQDGISVVVASPTNVPVGFEEAFIDPLRKDDLQLDRLSIESQQAPLEWLTERLYIEPESWVGWSVENFIDQLAARSVVVVDGVNDANWDEWRTLLRHFEVASRRLPSDERPTLLIFVRGLPQKRLEVSGAACQLKIWFGKVGELDMLTYVDQRLRSRRQPLRHHKLVVRQIAGLALWDIALADYLADQPENDLFEVDLIMSTARNALASCGHEIGPSWERGGVDEFDRVVMAHPFVLHVQGDPTGELNRRVWAAQAAELLPLIEVRRRELVKELERKIQCPFWIDRKIAGQSSGQEMINSLDELEVGALLHVIRVQKVSGDFLNRAEWLSRCRNKLAHLDPLSGREALDSRLHGSGGRGFSERVF
jgi:hypothetical protein